MAAIGNLTKHGILVKDGQSLEELAHVSELVFDKTGTLTNGTPEVVRVISENPQEMMHLLASLESKSEHPLAKAIMEKARAEGTHVPPAENFAATGGRGVSALIGGALCAGGDLPYVTELLDDPAAARSVTALIQDPADALAKEGKTPLFFIREKNYLGMIAVSDTVRADSRESIERWREEGKQVVMLTGDNATTAKATARAVGIDKVIADVRPADKDAHIKTLQAEGSVVAMIGDGINDAPALTRADVGIAIGGGTDVAIESADVVLMKNSLTDAANAMALGRKVVKNIRMNLFWAFFYNVLGIPVAAGVLYLPFAITLNPMIGAAAMSLSSVFVVTNALRLRFFRPREAAVAHDAPNSTLNTTEKENMIMKTTLTIDGMMCNHCRMHVEKALSAVDGVTAVTVDLESKTATVESAAEISRDVLRAVVTDAGYTPLD
jgi:heavy metal translocating P-type ATPase